MLNFPQLTQRSFWLSQHPRRHVWLLVLLALPLAATNASADDSSEVPKVTLSNVRRVFDNGEHNAFTDLVQFKGRFYLTFRSCPDGHMVHPTSSIRVLSSEDGKQWEPVYHFRVDKRDMRDPHFLVFLDRLFVYSGTWYSGDTTLPRDQYDLNKHLGYGVWTDDGESWSEPILLEGTYGHYVWRAAAHDGRAFLCGRRKRDFAEGRRGSEHPVKSIMLESDDGLIWKTRATFQETAGDEVGFLFESDGSLLGVGRRGSGAAELLRSEPPYTQWERTDLRRYVGGPLVARWGDRTLVGGRKNVPEVGPKTVLSWLVDGQLQDFAELPSGGDNSYPGFVALSPTQAMVSWYSSHEKDESGRPITAIYLADLNIQP